MKLTIFGASLILIVALAGILAPALTSHDPYAMSLPQQFQPPSADHIFGLDQNGSDVFSRVVFGARISLSVAFIVVTISGLIGLLVGSAAGYFEGWIDTAFMRTIDMLHAFPGFLLAIAMVAVMGPSLQNLILAMCLTGWTGYARLVRGEVLHLKARDYVLAARATGAGPARLLVFHIWPNLVGALTVQATFGMAGTVLAESSLSFLGLGAPPTEPTWGSLLNAGRRALIEAPHLSFFPGLAIFILVLGFNLFGDGLRDLLDPKRTKT
ncbi:MAG TPA: ABC transporter permease [Bdellovibrionales bacterium]|nr:ABC transporter permease [Bdellovibrionales bacterium]